MAIHKTIRYKKKYPIQMISRGLLLTFLPIFFRRLGENTQSKRKVIIFDRFFRFDFLLFHKKCFALSMFFC